ncbi:hypothetical protein [Arthrobacter sp. YD2]|uniref:hypothetical protein n=1 Tax=Arthrobacter sp. YD2 TaxID=3058046 RepID=UPI0025B5FC5A|nr:hypothetical protein [Arthrobacter sp. YD2]MDN3904353.1 hypothetical protein [Arthrobacter sp. YD2]
MRESSIAFIESPHRKIALKTFTKFLLLIATVSAVITVAILFSDQTRAVDERLPVPAEFATSEHRVREVAPDSERKRDWEYEDSSGNSIKMSKCDDSGFFSSSKTCFVTEDKMVWFEYIDTRGQSQEVITYDGVEYKAECIRNGSFWDWNVKMYCGSEPR